MIGESPVEPSSLSIGVSSPAAPPPPPPNPPVSDPVVSPDPVSITAAGKFSFDPAVGAVVVGLLVEVLGEAVDPADPLAGIASGDGTDTDDVAWSEEFFLSSVLAAVDTDPSLAWPVMLSNETMGWIFVSSVSEPKYPTKKINGRYTIRLSRVARFLSVSICLLLSIVAVIPLLYTCSMIVLQYFLQIPKNVT